MVGWRCPRANPNIGVLAGGIGAMARIAGASRLRNTYSLPAASIERSTPDPDPETNGSFGVRPQDFHQIRRCTRRRHGRRLRNRRRHKRFEIAYEGTTIARVPYLTPEDLSEENRDLLARPIALARALANAPDGARAFHGVGKWIRYGSAIEPRLRELAILQVGYLSRSPYEWSHHVKIGFDFGVSEADVRGLMAQSEGRPNELAPLARTVLKGAREMTEGGEMLAATFGELETALGRQQVVELVIVIAFYCAVVRVLASLAIDVEPEYLPYLERFPLPGPQA